MSDGDSYQASYSTFGNKILFVSRGRPGHTQAQIYEKDFTTNRERRLTFQNGNVSGPRLHPQERMFLYSSPTDELKENLLQTNPGKEPKLPVAYREPNEVYLHNLDTLEMTRITRRPGFDAEARFSSDGRNIFWTRTRADRTEVVTATAQGSNAYAIRNLGKNPTQYNFSPDGQVAAWIDWNDDFTVSALKLRKGKEVIEINADQNTLKTDIDISRDGQWLLWSQVVDPKAAQPRHEIWVYDLENLCSRKANVPDDSDRRYPALSPDLQWLTYTVTRAGKSIIARTTFVQPSGPCRESN